MSGSTNNEDRETLAVVSLPRPRRRAPAAHQNPGAELSDPPVSEAEKADDESDIEITDDGPWCAFFVVVVVVVVVSDIVLDSKKRKSSEKESGKKRKRAKRGCGTPRVPKKLQGEAPQERDIQCLPCLRAALRVTNRADGGRCLEGSEGRCARCFNGRAARDCVDVPVLLRPLAWALTDAIVGGAPALEISKIRTAVNWMIDNEKTYEDHVRFWGLEFAPPARPRTPPPAAPVLSVAPVVVVYDQAPVLPAPQVIDLTVPPPPAPPAAPAARGFEDFEARKARFLARVSSLLAADAMVPAVSFFLDQEFK
ncbi:hypothetical protein CSAL01_05238 [Colletotrichum salicis]|uniref:Uncharacterized protein n=1 Tax=Colletotrichum salicis TaxID=1209931 RepID=A0A135ULZ0_9PEZI|nr:hypothetical protein CSAL01_05238 [Colletotrichum salicis]